MARITLPAGDGEDLYRLWSINPDLAVPGSQLSAAVYSSTIIPIRVRELMRIPVFNRCSATGWGSTNESLQILTEGLTPQSKAYLESIGRHPEGTQEEVYARLSTPPERMAGFIEIVRAEHGGAEQYLLGQGVTPDELRRVRELMTSR